MKAGKWVAALALVLGALAGFSAGALVMMIHRSTREGAPTVGWLVAFLACGFLQLACNVGSRYTMSVALHREILPTLRQQVIARFLAAPLRKLEQAGAARLLGASTEDIQLTAFSILAMLAQVRSACAGVACLLYMAWLSPSLFVVALAATVVGLASFFVLSGRARRISAEARIAQDRAMVDVRTTVEGLKELKLDPSAKKQFLSETFEPDVKAAHRSIVRSGVANAFAASWGSLVILVATGVVLFSGWADASAYVLGGYALAFVYLHTEFRNFSFQLHPLRLGENALRAIDVLVDDKEAEPATAEASVPKWNAIEIAGASIA
ncbi:MAG: ABC transporter transmembrane domain-containing protein, partial [Polyangiaceae bacterium]